ncbi:universal stress protein [Mycobacterium kansasii]|uniref:Universal stress protein n=1 Tax=Mycobacterium kansasii TaxID=1768 RepID=A0A1V3XA40_MYCKA|nr:universal stress protein [Mycobacterium kansasii]
MARRTRARNHRTGRQGRRRGHLDKPRPHVTSEVLHAAIVPALVDLSKSADMVVVGCRGHDGVAGALLGSVSSGLAHHAHCPVAVIHDEDVLEARSPQAAVVVGIDGSPTSELATDIAFDEASRRGVELVALHAWSDMGPLDFPSTNWAPIEWRNIEDQEKEVLAERLSGWQERYPDVVVRKVVVCDRPAPVCSNKQRPLSYWWWAAMAAAGSPACCSARSAGRSSTRHRFR